MICSSVNASASSSVSSERGLYSALEVIQGLRPVALNRKPPEKKPSSLGLWLTPIFWRTMRR